MLQLRKTQLQTLSVSRQILQIYPLHKIQFFMIQYGGIYQFLSDVFLTVAIMNPTNKKPVSLTIPTVLFLHLTIKCNRMTAHNNVTTLYSLPKHSILLCSTIHYLYIYLQCTSISSENIVHPICYLPSMLSFYQIILNSFNFSCNR